MHIKRRIIFITALLLLLIPLVSLASVTDLKNNLDLITAKLAGDSGIAVYSLTKKQKLYGKNEKKLLNPASTTKVVTTAAALRLLGPDYKFHTQFFITPKNDLFIVGSGDPSLVIEELRMIAQDMVNKGIKKIRHVVVDDSYFNSYTQPGLPAGKNSYNSYTGALSLNFNRVKIKVKPGAKVGKPANVEADAGKITIPIENDVDTSGRRSGSVITLKPPPTEDGKELFTVSGRISISSKGITVERHVNLPPLFFAQTLIELLKQKGCRISGEIFTGPKPRGSKLVLDHESKPLFLIVKDMNKFSNNFIAEQLIKVLGAEFGKPPGSTVKGMSVVKKYMNSLRISPHDYILINGSGLTYDNRMTADQLIKIFKDMYSDKKIWPAFDKSLSIWGKDGTLRRRKKSVILRNRARGKTGSLDFVKTIAGVVPTASGELAAYAILLNGGNNMAGFRNLQEKIIEEIARFSR